MSTLRIFSRRKNSAAETAPHPANSADRKTAPPTAKTVRELFSDCTDFELRPVWPGGRRIPGVSVCWIDGLVSGKDVSEDVLRPLTDETRLAGAESAEACMDLLLRGAVWSYTAKCRRTLDETAQDLVRGYCAVLFDRTKTAVTFEVKTDVSRAVSEPTVEKTVKGAKDAFVETLRTNTSLIRRRLRTPGLKLRQTVVGRKSGTDVAILFLDGVADPETVSELERRMDAVDIDGLTSSGNLEQYITDRPGSLFPQLLHTERPDKFAVELLAGRVGIIVDGLPVGFLLPASLPAFLRVAEDRAQHWLIASTLMLLRWISLLISLLFPAFFTAVSMYHQEMIPTSLLLSMIEAKQRVPFSVAFEIFSMLLAFELLMEAGLRLPDSVGDTVSIIGALIVGQSAVEAKVVSPISVIVVAATAICGFTQPSRDLGAALRLLRLVMETLAVILGLYGIMLGLALLTWYLSGIESFGVPYLSPMAEGGFREVLKSLIRLPLPKDKFREKALHTPDKRNQK